MKKLIFFGVVILTCVALLGIVYKVSNKDNIEETIVDENTEENISDSKNESNKLEKEENKDNEKEDISDSKNESNELEKEENKDNEKEDISDSKNESNELDKEENKDNEEENKLIIKEVTIEYVYGFPGRSSDAPRCDPNLTYDLTFEDVKNMIVYGMTFEEVVELIGKPQEQFGSGVLWFRWDLVDGTMFCIQFLPMHSILSINQFHARILLLAS